MTAYVTAARDHIAAGENLKAAQLLNDTVGQHLPRIMKLYNYRYLSTLPRDEQDQVAFHVDQILAIRPEDYLHEFRNIDCGLKFLNGELDNYTTPEDARSLSAHLKRAEFLTIEQAGHFLDLEGRPALRQVRTAILDYFGAAPVQAAGRALDCFRRVRRPLAHHAGAATRHRERRERRVAGHRRSLVPTGRTTVNIAQSIAIVVPWALWLLYWVATSNRVKETARKEASLSRTLQSIPLIGGGALIVLPDFNTAALSFDPHAIGPLQLAGFAVLLAGLAFSVWARLHLGTNWSVSVTLKEGHELVRSGPYGLVRHPIYTGCLLALLGAVLIGAQWRGVAGLLLIFASLAYKVRVEESWLTGLLRPRVFAVSSRRRRADSRSLLSHRHDESHHHRDRLGGRRASFARHRRGVGCARPRDRLLHASAVRGGCLRARVSRSCRSAPLPNMKRRWRTRRYGIRVRRSVRCGR